MDEKLLRFFKKINFNDVASFDEVKLVNCVVNSKNNTWTINLKSEEIVSATSMNNLKTLCLNGVDDVKHIYINIEYSNYDPDLVLDYFIYYLDKVINENSSLKSIDKDTIKVEDNIISIDVLSDSEKKLLTKLSKNIFEDMSDMGISGYKLVININEEERESIKKQIEKDKTQVVVPEPIITEEKKKWVPKKKVDFQREGVVPISSIVKEENAVNLEAYVFSNEPTTINKKDGGTTYLDTLKISDNTYSILAKSFASDEEELNKFAKELKPGNWFHFTGQVRYDDYAKDLVFQFKTYEAIDNPTIKRKDTADEKRVELHAHTMMSQMDGVIDEEKLVDQAIAFGHAGIAITDHDGCQAFPGVFGKVTKYNKSRKKAIDEDIEENKKSLEELMTDPEKNKEGIKELERFISELEDEKKNLIPFKAAYGVELDMCDDHLNVCFNATDRELAGTTFVVFDTETTGFNPGLGDSLIELGGVKVKDGVVLDRFDELINPGHHIDEQITRVTDISDDDVKDADNEANVTKRFKEWIGDLPLVAHNARFDKNMLDMAYLNAGLGKLENPIIDTLNLSRVINRDLKRHSLAALGKAYGIDTGEADEKAGDSNELVARELSSHIGDMLEDIKVDGESILKVVKEEYEYKDPATETVAIGYKNNYYLKVINKASKTEKCNLEVTVKDDVDLILDSNEIKLHPAENTISFKLRYGLEEELINFSIYVGQHHGADVDSENTALIFTRMLKQIEGIETLNELNDLGKLEFIAFKNNPKLLKNIGDLVSFKNYIRKLDEDEERDLAFGNPFEVFGNEEYVWKYTWCHKDCLQMYENIPSKTFTEHISNQYDRSKHITMIAKNHDGLKAMFKLVSFANSNFLDVSPRIPRRLINDLRENLLIGSSCLNGEIFDIALTRSEDELIDAMKFYDYIEVQPIENYMHLISDHSINNLDHLKKAIEKIIKCGKEAGKIVVATGDVHNLNPDDLLYREIIVNQNVPGKGRHPLARYLNSKGRPNLNKENINAAIEKAKRNGNELNEVDIKVLKYIYALSGINSLPITDVNITELYAVDKESESDISKKSTYEEKIDRIKSSLRKLYTTGIVTIDYENGGTYKLVSKYTKGKPLTEGHIPNQFFRTTNEMLESFSWIKDKDLVKEIVITNPNSIISLIDVIEVIDEPEKPYSPIIEHSQEICRDLVFDKAMSMYGNPLPRNIEERIAQEFYGDKITGLVRKQMDVDFPDMSDEEKEEKFSSYLHDVIMSGYDGVVKLKANEIKEEEPDLSEEAAIEKAKLKLTGIIGGGFDVIYLIAQKLVKHSNDRGYLVGSRGSVGSSFVASMMGITECNGLPAHYYCPKCCHNEFNDADGNPLSETYSSGYDLPNKNCPECGELMVHQGNDMPFATFLGFAGEKVPDIDLNFSGEDQASAHDYTKVLFGTDNVYRAGTIGTVQDNTAFGYVQGFYEERMYDQLRCEARSYGLDIPGKDDLKKKGIIKSDIRVAEVERQAVGCTGVKRTTGQHPGGIVVVPGYKDIWDFTAFQYPADDPTSVWRTTHFDYHKIEADLLKLDILGHDDPTVLRMLQDLSGMDVTKIDLGDPDTMKIFTGPEVLGVKPDDLRGLTKDGRKYCPTGTLGVPEFGTTFLLGMLEETKPTTFAELIKISGLSHGTDVWLGNARDLIVNNVVPFSQVIGCRDDIMVNLMAWGIPAGKAFKIMEFVRKGKPSKDPATWKEHAEYLKENNIPDWYIESCRKIKYMFPKAHATAYVTSAFRIAYFKVHHPIWYYCAYLSIRRDQFDVAAMVGGENAIRAKIDEIDAKGREASNKDQDVKETLQLCLEMCCRGFYFKNIDIEKSDAKNFVITEDQKGLIIPFRALDGLGDSVAKAICKARAVAPFISQEDLKARGKCPSSAIEKLKELGCLDNLSESNQLSLF